MNRLLLTVSVVVGLWIAGITSASADCAPGYGECPGGGCAPLGSVCCGGNEYCPAGTVCTKAGDSRCLDRSSPSLCSDGVSYCEAGSMCTNDNKCLSMTSDRYCGGRSYCDPGYECAGNGKCRRVTSTAPSSGGGSNDLGSGVTDAKYCVDIESEGDSFYKVNNLCTFGINIKLQTMEFYPKETVVDSYYISANDNIATYSYFGYTPVVISACGRGSIC